MTTCSPECSRTYFIDLNLINLFNYEPSENLAKSTSFKDILLSCFRLTNGAV